MIKVCALVVSYNRADLLSQCISAISQQTFPISELVIVDNCSNVDVLDMLKQINYIDHYNDDFIVNGGYLRKEICLAECLCILVVHFIRLQQNTGGAGGFNHGVRFFYEQTNCDFLWLMDDDCVPTNTALQKLCESFTTFNNDNSCEVGFIVSRVNSSNGEFCRMTHPLINLDSGLSLYSKANQHLSVINAAFVSLLMSREVIKNVGYPIKDYFIWCDDLEYTYRITKSGYLGILTLDSVVTHKMTKNVSPVDKIDMNSFFKHQYGIRNKVSWSRHYRGGVYAIYVSFQQFKLIINANVEFYQRIKLLISLCKGWFFNPTIEKVD